MSTVVLDPFELVSGPGQARRSFTSINELARSILKHGLLNRPHVKLVAGRWVITAGERRVRAIRKLVEAKQWAGLLECEIDEGDELESEWKGLIENVQREDVPVWQLGQAFVELTQRGHDVGKIAAEIGKSHSFVSRAIRIAQGIHPEMLRQLEARLPDVPASVFLWKMASMVNLDTLEPDLDRQRKSLNLYLNRIEVRKKSRRQSPMTKIIVYRYKRIKDGDIRIPPEAEAYVNAIINYIGGYTRGVEWPER